MDSVVSGQRKWQQLCFAIEYVNKWILASLLELFTKAFDAIGHNVLIDKLPKFGIRGISLDWFADYLFNRSQAVEINCCRSVVEPIV